MRQPNIRLSRRFFTGRFFQNHEKTLVSTNTTSLELIVAQNPASFILIKKLFFKGIFWLEKICLFCLKTFFTYSAVGVVGVVRSVVTIELWVEMVLELVCDAIVLFAVVVAVVVIFCVVVSSKFEVVSPNSVCRKRFCSGFLISYKIYN